MSTRLSSQPFNWTVRFVAALAAEGLTPEMAEELMADRIAMHLWVVSAGNHLEFVQAANEKARAEKEAKEQEEEAALLARLPSVALEELIILQGKYYMSVRVFNSLKRADVVTVADIVKVEEVEVSPLLLQHERSLDYLRMLLAAANLPFPAWLPKEATS